MSAKKEKSESSKKSDKMIDTHREFLDMDTDEEDFGRQESPEVEEELPPEPEKPVFSEGDLVTLGAQNPEPNSELTLATVAEKIGNSGTRTERAIQQLQERREQAD